MPAPPRETVHPDTAAKDPARWTNALLPVLTSGVNWLYDPAGQPPQALLQPHGWFLPAHPVNRRLQFIPEGAQGHPVVVLHLLIPVYQGGYPAKLMNGLGEHEAHRLIGLINGLHLDVAGASGGEEGALTASIMLADPANEGLLRAVTRFRGGCGTHHTVFCGHKSECRWYADGYAMLRTPGAAA